MGQTFSEIFPPTAKWTANDVPDLTGKVMIVTGGNSGIGKEIVRALLAHNAKVYMAARNAESAKAAIDELKKDTEKEAIFLKLDLSNLKSVKLAVEEFLSKESEVHALFNNGGVMFLSNIPEANGVSADGYDIQWATNAVGPWYLTNLLLPALLAGASSSPDGKARVIFASSIVQAKEFRWDTMRDTPERKKMAPDARYGQSKFANTVIARELARRYGDKGIVSISLNPGGIRTELQRHMARPARTILNMIMHPPSMGAISPLYGATSPAAVDLNGKYLIPWARVGNMNPAAQDPEIGQKLWAYFEEQVKEK